MLQPCIATLFCFVAIQQASVLAQPVPQAALSGSPYEVGQQTAQQFRTQISSAIDQVNQSSIFDFSFHGAGAEAYSNLSWTVQNDFPEAYAIIQGMSDELAVELDVVMLLNVYVEMDIVQILTEMTCNSTEMAMPVRKGCSDEMLASGEITPGTSGIVHGHNEDGPSVFHGLLYYVDVALNLTSTPAGMRHYAAMTYPGMISSSSLGVSFTGQFYYTINALTPCPINTNRHAVPVEMLQHQLLTQARSLEEATALVASYTLSPASEGLAYGVNLNIGDLRAARGMLPRIVTIETSASKLMAALPLTSSSPPEFHFNNVLRMDVPYHYGASSESRMAVASAYRATARAPSDVLRFLGDQSNASFPVFRGGTPVDHALTLYTALITAPDDGQGALLRIYTANPRSAKPVLTRPLNLAPTPAPAPPFGACPTEGTGYVAIRMECGADCAAGTKDMTTNYVPNVGALPPSQVTSACFFAPETNAATMKVTVQRVPSAAVLRSKAAKALPRTKSPQVECVTSKGAQGTVATILPRGYSCTLTDIPWCSPQIDLDFEIVFSAGAKAKPYTLKIPCQQSQ
jgi:hypothetical protein